MSKIYFYYGAMNCGKSLHLLSNVHNYEQQGKKVLLLKPSSDTRNSKGVISSRVGFSYDAIEFSPDDNLFDIVKNINEDFDCIFIDEIHFATRKQIRELAFVCDKLDINVMTFGLKNSYISGELFEPIKELLYQANSVMEIKSTCTYCNSKATHNLRILNGKPIYDGEIINCGDTKPTDDYYIPVCRKHYFNPKLTKNKFHNYDSNTYYKL